MVLTSQHLGSWYGTHIWLRLTEWEVCWYSGTNKIIPTLPVELPRFYEKRNDCNCKKKHSNNVRCTTVFLNFFVFQCVKTKFKDATFLLLFAANMWVRWKYVNSLTKTVLPCVTSLVNHTHEKITKNVSVKRPFWVKKLAKPSFAMQTLIY